MGKRGGILLIFFFNVSIAMAQYPVFSHMDWMHGQLNPAFLGINKQEKMLLDYNRSWISREVNGNQGLIQYDRALVTSKSRNIGGIGASILSNRVNYKEVFSRFQASLGAAYAFRINRDINLNFGLQGTYHSDHVDNAGLLTGSQYVPGWGFDPGMGSNEPMMNLKVNYFGISSGLFLYQVSDQPVPDNYLGLSVKNLNRPVNSFYDEDVRLSPQFNLMGGARLLEGINSKLSGELWYANANQKGSLTIGVVFQANNLISARSSEDNISIRILSRYAINDKLLVGGQLLYDQFVLGFSYDIPTPNTTERTYDSGFEILLGFYRKVKAPKQRQRQRKTKYQPVSKSIPKPETPIDTATIVATAPEVIVIEQDSSETVNQKSGDANVGLLINDKPLEGKIYFDFASFDLTSESEEFLREFISEFYLREKTMIIVTGHTDNVGTNPYNMKLSLLRAEAVRRILLQFGVKEDQILVDGKGEELPLVPNDSESNRAKNRRVEISFY